VAQTPQPAQPAEPAQPAGGPGLPVPWEPVLSAAVGRPGGRHIDD
jgi:hypothetical protein